MSSAMLQAWAVTFFAGVEEGLAEKERSRLESFLLGMMNFRADPALWGEPLDLRDAQYPDGAIVAAQESEQLVAAAREAFEAAKLDLSGAQDG